MYKSYSVKNMPMKRHYGSGYNDFTEEGKSRSIRENTGNGIKRTPSPPPNSSAQTKKTDNRTTGGDLFSNLEKDDILLMAVALVLLSDGCDDKILLAALAFVYMTGRG